MMDNNYLYVVKQIILYGRIVLNSDPPLLQSNDWIIRVKGVEYVKELKNEY